MDIEEINTDRDKFLEAVSSNVEGELKKIGLRLINVNVTDISDESGYISALGKEAAAKAINDAKKSVAEKERDGSIGEANAHRDQRVQVAQADSHGYPGRKRAPRWKIAMSNAARREKEAEALKIATSAEKIQAAKALEEAYAAEQQAEVARYAREKATQEADVIVKTEIEKRKIELEAEAEAEQIRRQRTAVKRTLSSPRWRRKPTGMQAMLTKQADGLQDIVAAAGGDANDAAAPDAGRQDGRTDAHPGGGHQEHQDRQGHRLGRRRTAGRQNRHRRFCLRPDEEHPAHERAVRHGRHEPAGVFGH